MGCFILTLAFSLTHSLTSTFNSLTWIYCSKFQLSLNHAPFLLCFVTNAGPFGTIWQINKDTLLFAGSLRLSHNKKYDLLADNTLKISNISKTEAGVYNCTLSTQEPQSVVYHVRVKDGVRKPIPPKQHSHQSSPTSGHPNCQILPTTLLTSLFISLLWANFPFYSLATGTSNRPSMLL